jgi:L-aspartate oxidase
MADVIKTDFLVIGAGVAGLRAAVELSRYGDVLMVTKEAVAESNTHYAQGGIAVAMNDEDIRLHLKDTETAGDGLVWHSAAEVLVSEGPVRVAEMIEWGATFDMVNGQLDRTREGAHSLARILHANGDATGAEISRSLAAFATVHRRIRFAEWTTVYHLVVLDGRVIGADLVDKDGRTERVAVKAVLLASGGAGQVYSDTTNPAVATGDGMALAAEAGAELADMEFYQFHPTALSLPGAPRFLLSESLRGEGAYLRNDKGERFMEHVHPQKELAPRDVVARAIAREGIGTEPHQTRQVYLDMRHVTNIDLHQRFPGITATLAHYGLDLKQDLIPVRPAAHYMMGGIKTDLHGRTTLKGLYAAGETACTGVHGANRLASNSLLEGLVFGARASLAMLEDNLEPVTLEPLDTATVALDVRDEEMLGILAHKLRRAMWAYAGLLRDATLLHQGLSEQTEVWQALERMAQQGKVGRSLAEGRAMAQVAKAILTAALAREESRGAHYRNDFPQHDDARFLKHSIVTAGNAVRFEEW